MKEGSHDLQYRTSAEFSAWVAKFRCKNKKVVALQLLVGVLIGSDRFLKRTRVARAARAARINGMAAAAVAPGTAGTCSVRQRTAANDSLAGARFSPPGAFSGIIIARSLCIIIHLLPW